MKDLVGKSALVTGGTSGIGRAAAEALAREGAYVLISGRSEDRGREVVEAIRAAGGEAEFVRAELATADDVRALAERARTSTSSSTTPASFRPASRTSYRSRCSTRRSPST
jgi:NAD(P)-dependent dehydrogenase (short-subunit alcohol dehydrogenase family)